jgi:Tfp pilus assembly protein PilO
MLRWDAIYRIIVIILNGLLIAYLSYGFYFKVSVTVWT